MKPSHYVWTYDVNISGAFKTNPGDRMKHIGEDQYTYFHQDGRTSSLSLGQFAIEDLIRRKYLAVEEVGEEPQGSCSEQVLVDAAPQVVDVTAVSHEDKAIVTPLPEDGEFFSPVTTEEAVDPVAETLVDPIPDEGMEAVVEATVKKVTRRPRKAK